ncbi:KAP family P-loop NTPase fold protein [Sphingomonas sp.]|uniref:KAP family P-loop NTPase fold protein n=1 Tax=Sphingomonas sp. TaxID=28214 RepID=UPI003F716AF4
MADEPPAWADDKLNRRSDAKHLREILNGRYNARRESGVGSYILNIDAAWGEGKTYFLKNLCHELRSENYAVAYVNAWQDDHTDYPMTAVIAAIEEQISPFLGAGTKAQAAFDKAKAAAGVVMAETTKQVLFHALKLTTGVGVDKVIRAISEGQRLDEEAFEGGADEVLKSAAAVMKGRIEEHNSTRLAISAFRRKISDTLSGIEGGRINKPFFIFIDELDRCRPLYAIRMLEDMKHLFEIDGVVFVIATDTEQLAKSVSAIYGEKFDGGRYLRRFFDRVYVFPPSDKIDIIDHMFSKSGVSVSDVFFSTMGFSPIKIISKWLECNKFSNRDLEYVTEIVTTFVTSWNYRVQIEPINFFTHVGSFVRNPHSSLAESLTSGEIDSWQLTRTEASGYNSPDRSIVMAAGKVLSSARNAEKTPFARLTHDGPELGAYFRHEYQGRFSGGVPVDDQSPSVISQYFDRVRNAGRHIGFGK